MAVEQGVGIGRHTEDRLIGTWTKGQGIAGGVGAGLAWGGCYVFGIGAEVFGLAWWLVGVSMVASAIGGIFLTQPWEGQTLLDRGFRRGLFLLRRLSGTTMIAPPAEGGTPTSAGGMVVYYQGRPIARPYRPDQHGERAHGHAQ